jgi:hypothetical protein
VFIIVIRRYVNDDRLLCKDAFAIDKELRAVVRVYQCK